MGTPRDRATGILPWLALGMVWLLGLGAILTAGEPALTMLRGRRIGSDLPLTVCDVPNVCAWTGASELTSTRLPLEAVSRGSQLLSAVPGLLMIAVTLAVLYLGTLVVWQVSHGRVFAGRTVRGLGAAAGVLIGGGILAYALEKWAFTRAMADVSASGLMEEAGGMYAGAKPFLPPIAIIFGILALAAWAAFRHGAQITADLQDAREELDGVV
nr:hypothetical protein [Actinomycetales bacterium]